jgi:hypothetical protein
MTRKFALIPASLILAALANTLGATQIAVADAKYIKLIMLNKAKVDIQVFVQDFVGKKSDEQKKRGADRQGYGVQGDAGRKGQCRLLH